MGKLVDFEIINHGYISSQYFQGCGTAFTDFDYCITGAGNNAKEAYDDALEQIYSMEIDQKSIDILPTRPAGIRKRDKVPYSFSKHEENDIFWYVSIRIKTENKGD